MSSKDLRPVLSAKDLHSSAACRGRGMPCKYDCGVDLPRVSTAKLHKYCGKYHQVTTIPHVCTQDLQNEKPSPFLGSIRTLITRVLHIISSAVSTQRVLTTGNHHSARQNPATSTESSLQFLGSQGFHCPSFSGAAPIWIMITQQTLFCACKSKG
jgi:hypothetical protein